MAKRKSPNKVAKESASKAAAAKPASADPKAAVERLSQAGCICDFRDDGKAAHWNVVLIKAPLAAIADELRCLSAIRLEFNTGTPRPDLGLLADLSPVFEIFDVEGVVDDQALATLPELCELTRATLTKLSDEGAGYLDRAAGIEQLMLRDSRISDAGLESILKLTKLKYLDISCGTLTGAGFNALPRESKIEKLKLEELEHFDAKNMSVFNRLGHLRELFFQHVPLSGAGLKYLTACTQLDCMWLEENQLEDDDLRPLGELAQLKNLSIYDNPITDEGLVHLEGLGQLNDLTIEDCEASEERVSALKESLGI